jgi:hypothetical protein
MQKRIGSLLLLISCLAYATAARAGILYKNGPVNGICDIESCQADAWLINFDNSITNSFSVAGNSTITGIDFAVWTTSGETLASVDWSIGTSSFGGNLGSGVASGANLSETLLFVNQYGYDISLVSISSLNIDVTSGNIYWVTLDNALGVPNGVPVYWDENNGPSQVYQTNEGSIPSESFNIVGNSGSGSTPEPSSIFLFGSGIVGVADVLRRKLWKSD